MITRIIFHLGGYAAAPILQSFFVKNRQVLKENRVLYVDLGCERVCPDVWGHGDLSCFFHKDIPALRGFFELRKSALYSQLKALSQEQKNIKNSCTLCISWPNFISDVMAGQLDGDLSTIFQFFHVLFPDASHDFFFVLDYQLHEIEKRIAYSAVRGVCFKSPNVSAAQLAFNCKYSQVIVRLINIYGKDAVRVLFSTDVFADMALYINEFLLFAGLGADNFDTDVSPKNTDIAWDVVEFMCLANRAMRMIGTQRIQWSKQQELLAAGDASLCPYSEQSLKTFSARCEGDNNSLAAFLGVPNPFVGWTGATSAKEVPNFLDISRLGYFFDLLDKDSQVMIGDALLSLPEYRWPNEFRILAEALKQRNLPAPAFIRKVEPKVSILTLTYNHAPYIAEQIESVIAQQTDFPVEHIIHDDGSTDGTFDIIMDYAAKYEHITVLARTENSSWWEGNTIARLFELVRSEYVSLCDGDDFFVEPLKLQKQVDALDANKRCSLCFHPVFMRWEGCENELAIFPGPGGLPAHRQPYLLSDLLRGNFMSTSSVMYRWRFTGQLPSWFYFGALPGDWYWHILHAEKGRIMMIPEVMSVYRRHSGGIWAQAEADLLSHKKRHGLKELRTYVQLYEHFAGRCDELTLGLLETEFTLLYATDEHNGETQYFQQAVEEFPHVAELVRQRIAT